MFKNGAVLFLYAESPLHFGSGSSLGAIDLPIQRERHTQFPMGQASGIKGAMRDFVEQHLGISARKAEIYLKERAADDPGLDDATAAAMHQDIEHIREVLQTEQSMVLTVFGPDERDASAYGGALAFKDARVLLFPVRALRGVFAYITCPSLLEGLRRDLKHIPDRSGTAAQKLPGFRAPFSPDNTGVCTVSSPDLIVGDKKIILEDFAFTVVDEGNENTRTEAIANMLATAIFPLPAPGQGDDVYQYWRDRIRRNLVILSDEAFRDFVQFSTEVLTRIRISDDTGTVASGALFTEEHLPAETVLYTLALTTDAKRRTNGAPTLTAAQILTQFQQWLATTTVIQCGGDETVGRGLVYVRYWQG